MKTLIITDVQNDFIPGGALAVPEGDKIIPVVNQLQEKFGLIVATQDWHPASHISFASNHPGRNPFEKIDLQEMEQVLWPNHCVQGSPGAEFHHRLRMEKVEAIFRKGMDPAIDSYSGFYDNGHKKNTGLAGYLRERKASDLYFCGLAADYCVFYSIMDAIREGFKTVLIEDATRPIDKEGFLKIKQELTQMGCKIIRSNTLVL